MTITLAIRIHVLHHPRNMWKAGVMCWAAPRFPKTYRNEITSLKGWPRPLKAWRTTVYLEKKRLVHQNLRPELDTEMWVFDFIRLDFVVDWVVCEMLSESPLLGAAGRRSSKIKEPEPFVPKDPAFEHTKKGVSLGFDVCFFLNQNPPNMSIGQTYYSHLFPHVWLRIRNSVQCRIWFYTRAQLKKYQVCW